MTIYKLKYSHHIWVHKSVPFMFFYKVNVLKFREIVASQKGRGKQGRP